MDLWVCSLASFGTQTAHNQDSCTDADNGDENEDGLDFHSSTVHQSTSENQNLLDCHSAPYRNTALLVVLWLRVKRSGKTSMAGSD